MFETLDVILKTVKKTGEDVNAIKELLDSDYERKRKKLAEIPEDQRIDYSRDPLISTDEDVIDIERKLQNELVKRDFVSLFLFF